MTARAFLLILLFIACPEIVRAQAGALVGQVESAVAGKPPVAQADIAIPALKLATKSGGNGHYSLGNILAGRYWVVVRAIGYVSVGDSVTITAGAETARGFVLSRLPAMLDTAVTIAVSPRYVSPALRGFEERRIRGIGRFVGEDELRKADNRRLDDVLRKLPGLRVVRVGANFYAASTRNTKQGRFAFSQPRPGELALCLATIYLDGSLLYDLALDQPGATRQAPRNLEDFSVTQLAGLEYYPGGATLPAQFRGGECGTLLLWTRER